MSKTMQRRLFSEPVQIRANADGTVGARGYAAVFDSEAHGEVIRASAFNRTLAQRDNIRLLVNHEGVPLATTKSGTLTVGVDDHGLWWDAPSLDVTNPRVQELVSALRRGDIDQCSFAGYFTDVRRTNGIDEVFEVKATDVSVVTYPWYEETTAGLTGDRDADRALLALRSLTPDKIRKITIIALGDIEVNAPVADSGTDNSTETSMETEGADVADPAAGCDCPSCGAGCPDGALYCPQCGVSMPTDPASIPTSASAPDRSFSIADARALLGLSHAA